MADLYLSLGEAVNGVTFIGIEAPEVPFDPSLFAAVPATTTTGASVDDDILDPSLLPDQVVTLIGFDSAAGGIFTI